MTDGILRLRALFDPLARAADDLLVVARVVQPFHERRIGHAIERNGAGQPGFLEGWPVRRLQQIERGTAEITGGATQLAEIPLLAEEHEGPGDDGLADAAVADCRAAVRPVVVVRHWFRSASRFVILHLVHSSYELRFAPHDGHEGTAARRILEISHVVPSWLRAAR